MINIQLKKNDSTCAEATIKVFDFPMFKESKAADDKYEVARLTKQSI